MSKGSRVRARRAARDARRIPIEVLPRFTSRRLLRAVRMSYDHTNPGAYRRKSERMFG